MSLSSASSRLKTSTASRTLLRELVAGLEVDQARRLRAHGVVLDERPRAEVAQPHAAEDVRGRCRRVAPPETTVSTAPGMRSPAGSSSVKRACDQRQVGVERSATAAGV